MYNTIYNADCTKFLPHLRAESIDFILTDPPYLVRYQSRDSRTVPNDDNDAWLKPAFVEMYRVLKPDCFAVSFYGWPAADRFLAAYRNAGFRTVGHITFPKGYSSSTGYLRSEHETAHLLVKGNPWQRDGTIADVLPWKYTGNRLHPTQKPIEALEPLIGRFCPPGGIVLDPFAGSGSTLEAAQRLGRKWVGVELSAEYHAIANKRLSQWERPRPSYEQE
ncbi:DNA methyltransferase [Acidicapsa acidisoli]|uniref:DNA methyltransferase n=1 Tax=Acidicapsa acidisoli TaxID=1615681 RepID=UPI0021DF7B37|nr:DNA methyltransferase [Acidicapsa acidisoli]